MFCQNSSTYSFTITKQFRPSTKYLFYGCFQEGFSEKPDWKLLIGKIQLTQGIAPEIRPTPLNK